MSGWAMKSLGDICDVRDGTHDSPKQHHVGKPLVTSKNLKNGAISLENAYLISDADFFQINRRSKVDQHDILFSMIGTVGEIAIVKDEPDFAIKNVGLFKCHRDYDLSKWIYYYMKSSAAKEEILAAMKGSTQAYIALGDLRKFPIALPPLPEQKAIAAVLSSLDDKIELLHRQNKTLEAMAETLFRQWFVEEAQEDWEEKSLLDLIDLVGGGTPKTSMPEYWDGDIPWLSGGDISANHKGFVSISEKTITKDGLENSSAKLLPKFSTVVTARGTVGKYCLLAREMAFSQSNYGILPRINDCYFFTYLLVNHVVEELQSAAYGSVFDTITTSTFRDAQFSAPPTEKVREFEAMIAKYFDKKLANQAQIGTLEKLRDTLLPKLMSGEVRVAMDA